MILSAWPIIPIILSVRSCYTLYIISVLPKGRSFIANSALRLQLCPKAGLPFQTQEPRLYVLLGMNRCGSFPLLSAPHFLFCIWTNLKRSEKIPGSPTRRWGEWIWLTGPSGLHRNSPQGLSISSIRVFDQIKDPKIPITFRPLYIYTVYWSFYVFIQILHCL